MKTVTLRVLVTDELAVTHVYSHLSEVVDALMITGVEAISLQVVDSPALAEGS